MNHEHLIKLAEQTFCDALSILKKANIDYADEDNSLANFKNAASFLGTTKYDVLFIYWYKHFRAIQNHIKGRQGNREPIKGRFLDCINYLVLCYAMIVEDENNINYIGKAWVENEEEFAPTWDDPKPKTFLENVD